MSIYARVFGTEQPKLPWHQLRAAIAELQRGKVTAQTAASRFGLSAAERQQIQDLLGEVQAGRLTVQEIDDVMMLADRVKLPWFASEQEIKDRLGVP